MTVARFRDRRPSHRPETQGKTGTLCKDVVILDGPLGVTCGVLYARLAQGGVAHA